MTPRISDRRPTSPDHPGRKAAAFFSGAVWLLAAAGCLQPNPVGGPATEDASPALEDNGLRAGATSTTNWPPKAGRRHISILSLAGPDLGIAFRQNGEAATDPLFVPVRLSGRASLYKAGIIPALEEPRIAAIHFADEDTIRILPEAADSLLEPGMDTLIFNLRIETDSLEAWSLGYGYVPGTGVFFQTGYSGEKEKDVFLGKPDAYFKGRLDTSGALPEPARPGVSLMCFYIPGTHFYRPVSEDSLDLGPLAAGDYPLRLLRVTYPGEDGSGPELESFEVEMTRMPANGTSFRFTPGARVFSVRAPSGLELRPFP